VYVWVWVDPVRALTGCLSTTACPYLSSTYCPTTRPTRVPTVFPTFRPTTVPTGAPVRPTTVIIAPDRLECPVAHGTHHRPPCLSRRVCLALQRPTRVPTKSPTSSTSCEALSGWSDTWGATYCASLDYNGGSDLGSTTLSSYSVTDCMSFCYSSYSDAVGGYLSSDLRCYCKGTRTTDWSYYSCTSGAGFYKGALVPLSLPPEDKIVTRVPWAGRLPVD
jgi:hypothetical protein